ncbi:MAG: DUF58 domain-containing protein, partial [Muribaculaceae bacterium]|nr:DUF58 domain-containing protein [Muribaculaceae bacterium]
ISDFIDDHDFSRPLTIASGKHDMIAVQVYDKRDSQLPNVGLMRVSDLERGTDCWIDTSDGATRRTYNKWWYDRQNKMIEVLNRNGVDIASISTDEDYVKSLMGLFKRRGVGR